MIVGSDVVLEDRGSHPLKLWSVHGESMELFAVARP
jgi:hypothetical protein